MRHISLHLISRYETYYGFAQVSIPPAAPKKKWDTIISFGLWLLQNNAFFFHIGSEIFDFSYCRLLDYLSVETYQCKPQTMPRHWFMDLFIMKGFDLRGLPLAFGNYWMPGMWRCH